MKVLTVSLLLAASACAGTVGPISRADADKIADEMFNGYLKDGAIEASRFAVVEVRKETGAGGNGWSYSWHCRDNHDSAITVFVAVDGTADYSEAPDCAARS